MHLNECFALAFSRPAPLDDDGMVMDHDYPRNINDLSFLSLPSSSDATAAKSYILNNEQQQQQSLDEPKPEMLDGSILSAMHCIASEWGTKSQTNFYIPPQHFAGYSYLFEMTDNNHGQQLLHHLHRQHLQHGGQLLDHKEHSRHAFVYAAESSSNLHPHHYDVYVHDTVNSTHHTLTAMHTTKNDIQTMSPLHSVPKQFTSSSAAQNDMVIPNSKIISHHPITVPYMHPNLDVPVPPLQLPWYFGVLCWSFSVGGVVLLALPAKWALRGCCSKKQRGLSNKYDDDSVDDENQQRQQHWFPYYTFAFALIFLQSPCSFLADYVHMTNISPWHSIDRFLACFMMAMECLKIIAIQPYTRPGIYALYFICVCAAVYCFLQSQKAQEALDADGFIFWHNGWHCYPLWSCSVYLLEHYLSRRWGEYYKFDEEFDTESDEPEVIEGCKYERGDLGGVLLSTVAMKDEKYPHELCQGARDEAAEGEELEQEKTRRSPRRLVKAMTCNSPGTVTAGNANTMTSPGLRRSRRIAGQNPK